MLLLKRKPMKKKKSSIKIYKQFTTKFPNDDIVIILGDLNTKIGKEAVPKCCR
jgi:ribosomal protein L31E